MTAERLWHVFLDNRPLGELLALIALAVLVQGVLRLRAARALDRRLLRDQFDERNDVARRRLATEFHVTRAELAAARRLSLPGLAALAAGLAGVVNVTGRLATSPSVAFAGPDQRAQLLAGTHVEVLVFALVACAAALLLDLALHEVEHAALARFETYGAHLLVRHARATERPVFEGYR